ncbi:MAG: hypothetical protein L6R42_000024 [Xanthoria sp. 1 TBL-2021]|nr:MAG: hypothetical protein L6R42_000024 [Xanthoria sp. 1 TBL-2021]
MRLKNPASSKNSGGPKTSAKAVSAASNSADTKKAAQLLVLGPVQSVPEYIDNIPAEVHIIRDILGNVHKKTFPNSTTSTTPSRKSNSGWTTATAATSSPSWNTISTKKSSSPKVSFNRSDPDRPPPESWQPVLHRDIKPENIFLKLQSLSFS